MVKISRRFDELGADGASARLGIMGGTFDPIHIGHLTIAEEMRQALDLDAVLFIPTGAPVFKKDQHVTDAHDRVEMVRLAVSDNPHFDVSTIEADREGDTFTVDTLREMREHYPDNVTFYFMVGSDSAATVGKWRGSKELAQLTHLVVAAGRPGSLQEDELCPIIEAAGPFEYHIVHTSILAVSSTMLRDRLVKGDTCRYLIPERVLEYIRDHGLYAGDEAIASSCDQSSEIDPLSKEFYKARKAELKTRVSSKRFKHIMGVADTCEQLAEQYGVDPKKARLAGLLHDWDKGMNDEEARQRAIDLGMEDEIDPYILEVMPNVLHGITAAKALGREYPAIPRDVLQAIDRHTTAADDMTPLDMVLYIADAIEPGRMFGRIDELRSLVGEVSLEELYFHTYEYWVFLLLERRKPLHPDTIRIWNANVSRLKRYARRNEKQ